MQKVRELIESTRLAVVTNAEADGTLVSRPMAVQEVTEDGDVL